jgi:hypothetical protein
VWFAHYLHVCICARILDVLWPVIYKQLAYQFMHVENGKALIFMEKLASQALTRYSVWTLFYGRYKFMETHTAIISFQSYA